MLQFQNLRSVRQIVETSGQASPGGKPAITEGSLRWLIFNAQRNGLDSALVKVGRRVLIDVESFNRWLEDRRSGPTH